MESQTIPLIKLAEELYIDDQGQGLISSHAKYKTLSDKTKNIYLMQAKRIARVMEKLEGINE